MVYFTCASCGHNFKKNEIERHRFSCRSSMFTCIDCNKDFINDDYKMHTKCVTESERYESKSFVASVNKGEAKQTAWVDVNTFFFNN
jgi:cell growth-regulating nucleolar protein